MSQYERYQQMRDQGYSAAQTTQKAKSDNLDNTTISQMLQNVYKLTATEADQTIKTTVGLDAAKKDGK